MLTPVLLRTVGCCAALGSAAAWAAGSILFRRIGDDVPPAGMNFAKGVLSIVYLGVVLVIVGTGPVEWSSILALGMSAALGIALGDTLFFAALVRLGPRLTVLGGMLGPVLTVILAAVLLHEKLTRLGGCGVALTLAGVAVGTVFSVPLEYQGARPDRTGLILIALAALCMAGGTIFARIGVIHVAPLPATLIRMAWSVVMLGAWGCASHQMRPWLTPYRDRAVAGRMAVAGLVIVFGGFFLSLVALKYLGAAIATTLLATEPLLVLPLTPRQGVRPVEIGGALCALAGVALILLA